MKAIVCTRYGSPDVLKFQEVETPTPDENEVLVEVRAASVNAGDWHLMRADPFLIRLMFGLFKPKHRILGSDLAGRVKAVGSRVTRFREGDEVFGETSSSGFGAFAEYVAVPEHALVRKPEHLAFEEVAAVPVATLTALQGLRDHGRVQPGDKVLISGASGGVGAFAVQLAKAFGAEVTGVCSTNKVDMVHSLGADFVIDYKEEDFTQNGERYDLILGVGGYHSLFAYKRALRPGGRYVMTGGEMKQMFEAMLIGPWLSMFGRKKLGNFIVKANREDLNTIREMLETRTLSPAIDRCYSLRKVPEAIRYLEAGRAAGKVVIRIEPVRKSEANLTR